MKICNKCKSVNAQESTVCYFCGAALTDHKPVNINVNVNNTYKPVSNTPQRVSANPSTQQKETKLQPKEIGIWDAVGICFGKYATFKGRASRPELWYFILFVAVVIMISGCVFEETMLVISVLILLLPTLAVISRRLHDVGRSRGWLFLLLIIVFYGWLALAVICMLPGQQKDNEYGPYEG